MHVTTWSWAFLALVCETDYELSGGPLIFEWTTYYLSCVALSENLMESWPLYTLTISKYC